MIDMESYERFMIDMESYERFTAPIIIFGGGIFIQDLDGFIPKGIEQVLRMPSEEELDKIQEQINITRKQRQAEKLTIS